MALPEDAGAAFRADDRIVGVLQDGDLVSDADPERPAGTPLADDDAPIVVACDQVTDPRNLGAIIRSAAAFGAVGVIVPERRSAHLTATAWKASAGAAARVPVALATNLNRVLEQYAAAGFTVVGLAGEGEIDIADVPGADGPVLLVVGSEGDGLGSMTMTPLMPVLIGVRPAVLLMLAALER